MVEEERVPMSWMVTLVALLGCRTGGEVLSDNLLSEGREDSAPSVDSAADSSGLDSALSDSGTTKDTGEIEEASTWCLGWESGTLEDAGYSGSQVELDDGALVLAVAEGQEYSALIGEDQLDYIEDHALVLRSSHLGETQSVAVIQTSAFRVDQPQLWWWQLSEVRSEGIALEVELVEVMSSKILAIRDLPIETGGFIPALQESHSPIEGFPEIDYGDPVLGSMVQQGMDMSAFEGMELALRVSQHTLLEDNGFFTVLDQICLGRMAGPVLEWREP